MNRLSDALFTLVTCSRTSLVNTNAVSFVPAATPWHWCTEVLQKCSPSRSILSGSASVVLLAHWFTDLVFIFFQPTVGCFSSMVRWAL